MHGGTNKGPGKGNQNARKHGIYADVLNAEDREVYDRIEIGSVEEEIRIVRVKLRRALRQQELYDAVASDPNAQVTKLRDRMEVSEIVTTTSSDGGVSQTAVKRSIRDYSSEISRYTRLISDLEKRQFELGKSNPGSAEEIARKIKEALEQIDAVNSPAPPPQPVPDAAKPTTGPEKVQTK